MMSRNRYTATVVSSSNGQASSPGTVISTGRVPAHVGPVVVCLAYCLYVVRLLSRLSGLDSDLWILTKLPSTVLTGTVAATVH
jgi:hypothetical protein